MPPDEAKGTQNDIGSVSEDDDGEQLVPCEFCHQPPTTPAIPPYSPKIHPIFSTPSIPVADSDRSRCRMDRERFEPGGRECPLIWCANVSVSGRGRRWPTRFRWRAALFRERRAKPATGPGSCCLPDGRGGSPVRACGGHGASFRARVRAGTRAQSISRGPSRPRPGQPGWRALKRGGWISQPPRACEADACRVGTPSGEFRAARCQRHPMSRSNGSI
jgi:hypothetical protein